MATISAKWAMGWQGILQLIPQQIFFFIRLQYSHGQPIRKATCMGFFLSLGADMGKESHEISSDQRSNTHKPKRG